MEIVSKNLNIDFMRMRKAAVALSVAWLLLAAIALAVRCSWIASACWASMDCQRA